METEWAYSERSRYVRKQTSKEVIKLKSKYKEKSKKERK